MTRPVAIPAELLERVYAHARAAFPAECCGYLVGADKIDEVVACENAIGATDLLPGRTAERGFVIAGAELFAFARTFESPRPARVVYHSHTNGRAYFSATDQAMARGGDAPAYPVQHVVVGVAAGRITEAAQFAWSDAAREFVEIARWSPIGSAT